MSFFQPENQIFTFYSYKGGVGRTMALANVACQLANRSGKNVVCVDWDLEAPGLHYYFGCRDEDLRDRPGLLDYLLDFKWQVTQGAKGHAPAIQDYIQPLPEPHKSKIRHGSVRFIHCGRTDPNYMKRVQDFDWAEFYTSGEGFRIIETLKHQLLEETDPRADVVLIDARAGQAEVGTTPTIQMPDAVVVLFTSNRQSLEGADRVARQVHSHPLRKQLGRPPAIVLVPSRVFPREETFQRWIEKEADPVFKDLIRDGIIQQWHQPRGLFEIVLPVDPKWSVEEQLPILDAPSGTGDQRTPELNEGYVRLSNLLANLTIGTQPLLTLLAPPPGDALTLSPEQYHERIVAAAERGDELGVAFLQNLLAIRYYADDRFEEAESAVLSSMAAYRKQGNHAGVGGSYDLLACIRARQESFQESYSFLQKAFDEFEQAGYLVGQGRMLQGMGLLHALMNRFKEAERLFHFSVEYFEKAGDKKAHAQSLFFLGKALKDQKRMEEATLRLGEALSMARSLGESELAQNFKDELDSLPHVVSQQDRDGGN